MTDGSKQVLLKVADGPEGFELYTSEHEAVVDWAATIPALYLTASVNEAFVKLGPFHCSGILEQLKAKLNLGPADEPV